MADVVDPSVPPVATPAVAAAPTSASTLLSTDPTAPATPAAPSLTLPGKDAKPEDWAKFYDDIGAPKTADGYELPVPDGENGEFAKTAAEWMAEQRLTPHQAKGLGEKWNAFVAEQKATSTAQAQARETERITALDAKHKAEDASLRNEWGQNHAAEMANATRGAVQFIKPIAGEKAADVIVAIENVIGYGATVRFLNSLGKGMGEAQARGLGTGPADPIKSMADRLYPTTVNK